MRSFSGKAEKIPNPRVQNPGKFQHPKRENLIRIAIRIKFHNLICVWMKFSHI
jgi:hypothetical protein